MPRGYSLTQIALHWTIAVLVLLQFLNDEAIGTAWRALRRGTEPPADILATAHIYVGVAILALVLWRIVLRLTRGAPPPPASEPRPLQIAAAATHGLLYLLLLALPVSGLVGWYGGVGSAGEVHELMKTVLMLLIFLHIAGALYQRFVLKTDVVTRMIRPGA